MSQQSVDAVLAGTKGFAVALLAPVTARVGTRPRVAADAGKALGLCGAPGALVIVEFLGAGSLPAIQELVRDGRGLRVVAGVSAAHAAADETLRALGVQVARWDGKVDGVLGAVERALGAGPAPAPAEPSAPPAARAPAVAPAVVARPPAWSPPRPGPPVAAPARPPQAAAPAPPRPAALAAPRPAPLQPTAAVAAAPPAPRAPGAAPPPSPAAAAPRPAAPRSPAPPPRAAPAAAPPPAAAVPAAPAVAAAPAAPPPVAAAPVAPLPAERYFADLQQGGVGQGVADPGPAPAAAPATPYSPNVYVPPPVAARAAWPAGICSAEKAEEALRRALAGGAPPTEPLGALAQKTLDALSAVERAVLAGQPQPVDAGPIRRAAVMKLRVAEALSSAPPTGGSVDSAALSGILGEIDALLAEVAPLVAAAPPELAPALESIRNGLVSEAIDFSEAAQRVAAAPSPAAAVKIAPRTGPARLLSIDQPATTVEPGRGRRIALGVLLAAAIVLAALYHGMNWYRRTQAHRPIAGFPGMTDLGTPPGMPRMIVPTATNHLPDPADVARFRAAEEAKGNVVVDTGVGPLLVTPGSTPTPKSEDTK